ncbi:MBL fold metallo-hydrolase [Ferrimonas lipolytica]|uniref:MBL fold metallo-hydrolase n=1 Tax=Ferrimonas lipolytica TaxID=2724191 RepID=A0A6H1UCV5_9GAMM|nr:MBL fold metallo-hydrolase [Ferrimonas lipolytica]QIZ76420.1 MBL fold metallo-hydrolase [Ferrimonas lipolytica]
MLSFNRLLARIGAVLVVVSSASVAAQSSQMLGHVSITELDKQLTIHSFTAPEESELVNSHIIETPNRLIMIDGQFFRDYAKQLRGYVDGLGKPLDRVYLSHQHPDHWFGLEMFAETPIYAQAEIAKELEAKANMFIKVRRKEFGERVTATPAHVDNVITSATTIDGIKFEFELVKDAEADYQTIVRLPQYKVAFVQDLLSNNAHAFFAKLDFSSWQTQLNYLQTHYSDWRLFIGHGFPAEADADAITQQQQYLETAERIVNSDENIDQAAMTEAMLKEYPSLGAAPLVDISSMFFHKILKPRLEQQPQ